MGCVSAKKQNSEKNQNSPNNQQPSNDSDEDNFNSSAQSPAMQKIRKLGAITHDEVKDYVEERRNQVVLGQKEFVKKKSGRYTPTIIYKYNVIAKHSNSRSPAKATNSQYTVQYQRDYVSK